MGKRRKITDKKTITEFHEISPITDSMTLRELAVNTEELINIHGPDAVIRSDGEWDCDNYYCSCNHCHTSFDLNDMRFNITVIRDETDEELVSRLEIRKKAAATRKKNRAIKKKKDAEDAALAVKEKVIKEKRTLAALLEKYGPPGHKPYNNIVTEPDY